MKKLVTTFLIISLISITSANAQVGKFLKNVKNNVTQDLMGKPDNTKPGPEPPCACDPADLIVDLGKYKIGYTELNIDVLADGKIVLQDKMTGSYYLVKDGVTEGPLKENDPRVKQFEKIVKEDDSKAAMMNLYKDYIFKQGERYIIKFAGKTYGPYDLISYFALTRSKNNFAATVTETMVVTENDGKKMEEAMNNAKTEQEKMDLAMKYSQQVQQKLLSTGDPMSIKSKTISNVPVNNDLMFVEFNTTMKYDEILFTSATKITDLQGKTIFSLPYGKYDPNNTYISSDNTRYATYSYGTLTISDGKSLAELFNPGIVKTDGKIYLTYMYYSPKRNAIMQCKVPF